ncbi:DUF5522 domain-containing protein [Pedobacter immunditicola]|uniref:DUF5522 domain-containing protein n=1 Tax=Pedobacter immunditicola TaxID=3133440 RepID=UPI00309F67AD
MEEGTDYYFNEQGLMVFTEVYHLKRGSCCKNKCRHCPWKYGRTKSVAVTGAIKPDQGNGNT